MASENYSFICSVFAVSYWRSAWGRMCPSLPAINAGDDRIICNSNPCQLGVSGNNSLHYIWSSEPSIAINYLSGTDSPDPTFTPPHNSCGIIKYTLTVSNDCEESASDVVLIRYNTNPSSAPTSVNAYITSNLNDCYLSINIGTDICPDKVFIEIWDWSLKDKLYSYELNSGIDFNCCNFTWSLPIYITKCNNYKVKVYSSSICQPNLSNIVILDWLRNPVISLVQAPNVITPNNDGFNDQLCFIVNNAESYTIEIHSRSGSLECYSSGIGCNKFCLWDGSCQSGPCADGTYYYVATFSNSCQNTISLNGIISLLRH